MKNIYLDNAATTRISPEALEKYCAVSSSSFGNPSSLHALGFEAERIVTEARNIILDTVGATDSEIIFTSSGSEANNLAILGRALSKERYLGRAKIITTMGEHASVSEPFERLRKMGFTVAYIPTVGGEIDLDALRRELCGGVILVSCMMVNNETGAIYNLPKLASLTRSLAPEALIHVDATQGYMKIPFTKAGIGADLITLSSHKIHGPKGVGALVVDKRVFKERGLSPLILGGGQERGLRSGTENVPGIAAFGEAARLGKMHLGEWIEKMTALRKQLIERLATSPELSEISPTLPKMAAPHILNITLPGIKSETMLHFLSSLGVFVSSGSACSSNTGHISSALTAYGRSEAEADSSIRISFSHENTTEDIDALCEGLAAGLSKLSRIKK